MTGGNLGEINPTLMGVLLIGYVALQIGIGLYVARGVKSETDYFLAGRNIGIVPIALSIFATWFGAETVMGSSAAIAEGGLAGARAEPFGYALALLLMALIIAGAFRAKGYITIADFFRERYGPRAEVLASVLSVIVSVIWASAQLLAFAVILKTTFDVPQTVTLIAATLIDENQNSNSPYARADIRFTPVKIAIRAMPMPSSGTAGNHPCKICAPAIASIATTTTQKYQ
jgi:Na+/proline symporter